MLSSISIIPSSQHEATSSSEAMRWDALHSVNGTPAHSNRARIVLTKAINFFTELKRRKVYRVAAAYAVASWLLIQAASIFLPTFDAPPCMMRAVVVFLALGFVVAAILSWIFDITPQGIKRTADISPDNTADIVRQLEVQIRQEFVRGYLSGLFYAGMGDKTKAIDYLQHEYLNHDYFKYDNVDPTGMSLDATLDELRGTRHFQPMAERLQ